MKIFNASELNQILAGELMTPINVDVKISHINTDTRSIKAGDTFVAISGEQFDGHAFVSSAVEKGAHALLVEKRQKNVTSVPQIIVKDTRIALGLLAATIRKEFVESGGKVVGVTGSVGKTTNKQMLTAILAQAGKTHATKGNLNNDLGVPFTWFDLPQDAKFSVIEMGASHQGEIAYLADITKPQTAMITNAGEAHLEGFGGQDGVAKGKGELFIQLAATDTAVLNADDYYSGYWKGLLDDSVSVMTFSLLDSAADVFATDISADGSEFTLCNGSQSVAIKLPTVGHHNVMNALGCAACALTLGLTLQQIAAGLAVFETAKGRLLKHTFDKLTIIDDSYNANPTSVRASADILAASSGYRIMVLGNMAELGENERELHEQLGNDISEKADCFFCLGNLMAGFVKANHKAKHYLDKKLLIDDVRTLINEKKTQQSITVLIKGSRSMEMEQVVDCLLENF